MSDAMARDAGAPDASAPDATAPDADGGALVAEAATKSALLWVRPPGDRAWPAWHVWHDGGAYVVSGPGEQALPPLDGDVEVILRSKDTGARLVTIPARAAKLDPADPAWEPAAAALKAQRLNAPDTDTLLDRWARTATITRLTPSGPPVESPGRYDDASGAAPPPPSPATTARWRPWHLGGRKRRWR